ncbi:MAG: hypothetical protein AWM53_00177 [Candidatus Dichloromethanomonas elyunquensis]|nr:MAG: hypothetical protein AWM53_00177 [Candidatus Dichloromethanomonas elyunquensis]
MGTSILKGITTGLLVTVLTLLAVLGATLTGIDKNMISYLVDFGLLLSCLASGYRASRNSGRILPAGLASGGYAIVGVLLLALYFPINIIGAVKIISEGTGLGFLAGVLGAGILSSAPEPYDYPETGVSNKENYYDRNNSLRLLDNEFSYSSSYNNHSEEERAKIYEICNPEIDMTDKDEEDAFDWWSVESKKQLKSR